MRSRSLLALAAVLAAPKSTIAQISTNARPNLRLDQITLIDLNSTVGRDIFGTLLGQLPDPDIIRGVDGLWKVHATNSKGRNVPVATSPILSSIWVIESEDALPILPSWVNQTQADIWAPDVIRNDDGTYVLYYVGRQANSGDPGKHCVGLATSIAAVGPFQPHGHEPLICDNDNGGIIDASGYDDGRDRWIVWKVDGNSMPGDASTCSGQPRTGIFHPTPIKIQRMARNGITLLDNPKTIFNNEGAADNGIVEAPTLWKIPNGGDFVLFFSTNCFSSDAYDIQYAFSGTIDGKYADRRNLLNSDSGVPVFGPGGLDLDLDGKSVVFHGTDKSGGGNRHLYSAELVIDS